MARNDALLRTIIESPDEDTPRLAYADWLDENGDSDADGARAEFIRVQITLARLSGDDPRRPGLARRETELLDRYSWRWAAEFGTSVSEWQFGRGFVERVCISLEMPSDGIVEVLRKGPVRHLRDTGQFCDLGPIVEALLHLKRLTGLEFWGLYAFDDALLRKLLTSLHLAKLRTLILHHDRNGNVAAEDVIVAAVNSPYRHNVEELAVNVDSMWRGPSRTILQALAASPHLRKLRKLNLTEAGDEGNRPEMDVTTLRALGQSANLANLEELDLGNASFALDGWDEVLKWPFLPRLQWLGLSGARQVNPPSYLTVANLRNLPAYRQGFDAAVANVDWDSPLASPWRGTARWRGQSWGGLRQRHLFAMWPFVRARDYDGLEAAFRADCVAHAGETVAAAIDGLPFDEYRNSLRPGLEWAVASAGEDATAIYLRIRHDLQWDGEFHVSGASEPAECEPHEEFSYTGPLKKQDGPNFPAAAKVRQAHRADNPLDPGGAEHYLIARTVAAFGRCVGGVNAPVPVFFSCMYAVFRMSLPS